MDNAQLTMDNFLPISFAELKVGFAEPRIVEFFIYAMFFMISEFNSKFNV